MYGEESGRARGDFNVYEWWGSPMPLPVNSRDAAAGNVRVSNVRLDIELVTF